jgi:hypothetical protein
MFYASEASGAVSTFNGHHFRQHGTFTGLARLVADAQASEAPVQRLADEVAGRFCYGRRMPRGMIDNELLKLLTLDSCAGSGGGGRGLVIV